MSLLLIAPHDGTVRWQRGIMNNWPGLPHGTAASLKLKDRSQVLDRKHLFFFLPHSLSPTLFFSLLGNGQKKKKTKLPDSLKTWRVHACSFFSFLSRCFLSARKASRERRKQEKKRSLAEQVKLFNLLSAVCQWDQAGPQSCKFLLYSAEVVRRTHLI